MFKLIAHLKQKESLMIQKKKDPTCYREVLYEIFEDFTPKLALVIIAYVLLSVLFLNVLYFFLS